MLGANRCRFHSVEGLDLEQKHTDYKYTIRVLGQKGSGQKGSGQNGTDRKVHGQNGMEKLVRIKSSINQSRSHWQYDFFINPASTLTP